MNVGATNETGTVETVVEGASRSTPEGLLLARGELVGRYVIIEKVGAGGMGVVYAAYDPELDRKVALKWLHKGESSSPSRSDGRSRLIREAQAMARLSHPNVVAVHDVGVHGDRVFLAMEFVEGQTLGEHIRKASLNWKSTVDLFVRAGRGLAAAHAAGLIHRDFKPDNVLIGERGVVKVTDFGLARERDGQARAATHGSAVVPESVLSTGEHELVEHASTEMSLTRTGAILGTPAYMAPEQHLGLPTDARTDQFSFCVALYEALYGSRPFQAKGRAALALAVTEGQVQDAPAGSQVPGRLRGLILRGLAPDADERFASMGELLDALAKDPNAGRRQVFGWVAAVLVSGITVGGLLMGGDEDSICEGMTAHLEGVWDDAARAKLEAAVSRSGIGFADSTVERVREGLDTYTVDWVKARKQSCEATQVRGEQSRELMDLRMVCLDERLSEVRSLVEVLSVEDAAVAQKAVSAVSGLRPIDDCSSRALVGLRFAPPDAAQAEQVALLRAALGRSKAHGAAGQYDEGLRIASETFEAAQALDYGPLLTEAGYYLGRSQHATGHDEAAEATLERAFFSAVRDERPAWAARSAVYLATVVGSSQARNAEGWTWGEHAEAQADVSGEPLLQASALHALADVAHKQSKFDQAKVLAERAMAIRTKTLGRAHTGRLPTLNLLGLIASDTGKFDEAQTHYNEGLELGREVLGPDHPDLARFLNNLAKIAWMQGKLDEAEENFETALQLQATALGPEHRNVAQLHNNLAAVAASRGDMQEAGRRFKLALGIWEKALGPEHPSVADGLNNLAVVSTALERYEESKAFDERALAIRKKTMEPGHPAIAQNLNNLGEDLRNLGDFEGAAKLHREAVDMWEAKLGPDHDDVASGLTALGEDLLRLGRHKEALPIAERAYVIRKEAQIDEVERAHTKWVLARALGKGGASGKRAKKLAEEALAVYRERDESKLADAVRGWLGS